MDYKKETTPCGLNCANCELYFKNDPRDPRDAKPIIFLIKPFLWFASLFSDKKKLKLRMLNNMMKIPKDQDICRGCRNEEGKIPFFSTDQICPVYECTQRKNIHNCSECEEFPCEYLYPKAFMADMLPHNIKITNCCLIKKYGLEKWAKKYSKKITGDYFRGDLPVDL